MAGLEAAGQAPEEGGGDLGGGDLGGDMDLGGDDLGGDLGGDDLGGDLGGDDLGGDTGGEEEGDLLAEPPAKRDDDAKPNKRGPYKKHKISYRKGGFSKQMKNQAFSGEVRGSTARTTFPGKVGFGGMDSLARGIYEENEMKKRNYLALTHQ